MIASMFLFAAAQAAQTGAAPPAPMPSPAPMPCLSPQYRQMDFWVGDWELSFRKADGTTGRATNRITRDEYGPCVIVEHFEQADINYVGTSLSTYDLLKGQWVQTWVDSRGGYITLAGGAVEGKKHRFQLDTIEPRGPRQQRFRMIWDDVKANSLTWRWQKLQPDGSYADAWVIHYKRK
jgi:hypothetical protein